jgi:hypothetical protein
MVSEMTRELNDFLLELANHCRKEAQASGDDKVANASLKDIVKVLGENLPRIERLLRDPKTPA